MSLNEEPVPEPQDAEVLIRFIDAGLVRVPPIRNASTGIFLVWGSSKAECIYATVAV
jgi:hypothetical protein